MTFFYIQILLFQKPEEINIWGNALNLDKTTEYLVPALLEFRREPSLTVL